MTQAEKAAQFSALHVRGEPLVLYNIWDAGSAKAVAGSGAKAVATGSWSMAAAQGYPDGEVIPLDTVELIVRQIARSVDVPVTVDLEGAYAVEPEQAAANVARIVQAGAIGINFEDGIIGGDGLHAIALQCRRIQAIRAGAEALGVALFINARTDLFLQAADAASHVTLLDAATERAQAFADAGASGYFAPGLADEDLIGALCAASSQPVNIMMKAGAPSISRLAALGVSRISYGPMPYVQSMQRLGQEASTAV
jgi:2-methylisocitrate lyase-like PEP mutase family enzyme